MSKIVKAALLGEIDIIESLLADGENPNEFDFDTLRRPIQNAINFKGGSRSQA